MDLQRVGLEPALAEVDPRTLLLYIDRNGDGSDFLPPCSVPRAKLIVTGKGDLVRRCCVSKRGGEEAENQNC